VRILGHLETKTILKYRLVSKRWKALASLVCRDHLVRLDPTRCKLKPEKTLKVLTKRKISGLSLRQDLPWSCAKFNYTIRSLYSVRLLDSIMTREEPLKKIHLNYSPATASLVNPEMAARILSKIPNVSLEIHYDASTDGVLKVFCDVGIRLRKLDLRIYLPETYDPVYYAPLENFLAANKGKLVLCGPYSELLEIFL